MLTRRQANRLRQAVHDFSKAAQAWGAAQQDPRGQLDEHRPILEEYEGRKERLLKLIELFEGGHA